MGGMRNILFACVAGLVASVSFGDAWSDVKYYWSFDKDVNGDGVLQAEEVRDVRYWGSTNVNGAATGGLQAASIAKDGDGNPVSWRRGAAYWPARGVAVPNTSWIHFSCVTNAGSTQGFANGINFPGGNNITGDVTVVTRVRVERFGAHNSSKYAFLLNNGLQWGYAAGDALGFVATDTAFTNAWPFVMQGQQVATMTTCRLTTNTWYDVGYSLHNLGGGKASVLFMVAGATTYSSYHYDTVREQTCTIASGAFTNEIRATTTLGMGAESTGQWHDNGTKGIVGDVHRLAMWERALSRLELAEALGQPATCFQVGIEDDANGEFGLVEERDATAAYAPDTAPWREMVRSLSAANPTLTLTYTPRSAGARALGTLFRFKTTSSSETRSSISLKIGDTSLGTKYVSAGNVAEWFVKGGTLAAGANTIEVKRVDGSGSVCAIDNLELTGSMMVGIEDGSNVEFTRETYVANTAFEMNWNTLGLQRCVVGSRLTDGCASHYIWFKVPESLARRYDSRYVGRVIAQGCNNYGFLTNSVENGGMGWKRNQWPIAVELNGVECFATNGMPDGTYYSFDIPRGTFSNGWNVIRTHINAADPSGKGYWINFDFHKVEFLPNPTGSFLILR